MRTGTIPILIAFVLLALAAPRRAVADDAPSGARPTRSSVAEREEARREFAAGQAADRQHDWKTAIEHYERANELVPHPNAMFNIATDHERLGDLREAAVWYQHYIDAAKDSPDRDKVIRRLRELQEKPGTITVRSTPTGARLLVDGVFVGITPYSGHIQGGRHQLALEHGSLRDAREVAIEFGEPALVDVVLERRARPVADGRARATPRVARTTTGPPRREPRAPATVGEAPGTLRIGGPDGALVAIDDRPIGTLPFAMPLAPGVHKIEVTLDGYAPFDTHAEVRSNQETVIDARLARALGADLTAATAPKISYLLGAGAGADARGTGEMYLVEAGVRSAQYDASARVGKTAGLTTVDLLVRWSLTRGRVAPWLGIGYSFVNSDAQTTTAGGYLVTGGLRFEIVRGEHYGMALLAESGLRYYAGLDLSEPGRASDGQSGLIVPLMTSLQITYR